MLPSAPRPQDPVPVATPLSLPPPDQKPTVDGKWKDLWAGLLFWVHVVCIVGVAFALGVPAVQSDSSQPEDDPNRPTLDFNAALFLKVIIAAVGASVVVSAGAFYVLSRFGGALIKVSLYSSFVLLLVMAGAMCVVNIIAGARARRRAGQGLRARWRRRHVLSRHHPHPTLAPAGVVMLIPALLVLWFIYAARRRIPFAAAHLQAACDATSAHPALFGVAVLMLLVQAVWNITWAAAALGVEHTLNVNTTSTSTTPSTMGGGLTQLDGGLQDTSTSSNVSSTGSIAMFCMLVSFYWGASVFTNIVHFTAASVVGSWWYIQKPVSPVWNALKRAWTVSFGSIGERPSGVRLLRAGR
jgi:hypothetical protein